MLDEVLQMSQSQRIQGVRRQATAFLIWRREEGSIMNESRITFSKDICSFTIGSLESWNGLSLKDRKRRKSTHPPSSRSILFLSFSSLHERYRSKERPFDDEGIRVQAVYADQLAQLKSQLEAVHQAHTQDECERSILVEQLVQQREKVVQLKTKLQGLKDQYSLVRSELGSSRALFIETTREKVEAESHRDEARSEVKDLRSELHAIRVKLYTAEEKVEICVEPLQDQLRNTESNLEKANAALAKMKVHVARLQGPSDSQLRNMRSQISTLKEENSNLKQDLKKANLALRASQKLAQSLEDKKESLETSLQRMKEKQHDTQTQLNSTVKEGNRLCKQLQATTSVYETILEEKEELKQKTRSMRREIMIKETESESLNMEKKKWWFRLAVVQDQLDAARNQLASLDFATRTRLESRQEIISRPIKRGNIDLSTTPPSVDIIRAVQDLNDIILERSKVVARMLEDDTSIAFKGTTIPIERVEPLLGEMITTLLRRRKKPSMEFMTVVVQVLLVHWCTAIIQAWYPKRQSFADLLISLSSETKTENNERLKDSKTETLIIHARSAKRSYFSDWEEDIIIDIHDILSLGSLTLSPPLSSLSDRFVPLIKAAHNLRTSLAERDACGGLELLTAILGTPYQPKSMQVRSGSDVVAPEPRNECTVVAGNIALGLHVVQRSSVTGNIKAIPHVVLKPQVVLKHSIEALYN